MLQCVKQELGYPHQPMAVVQMSLVRDGITTLVPKSREATQPGDNRPITFALTIAHLFHKVLAMRFEEDVPLTTAKGIPSR